MSETRHEALRRLWFGIFFMCAATTAFPVMNGIVQVLSRTYPSEQVIWARTAGHLAVVLLLVVPRYGVEVLATRRPAAQIARSLLLLGSTTLFFFAVKDVPLAQAASISFMAPFFVTLLAVPMLGERIDATRLVCVLIGFCGVLVVIRPGSAVFQPASLLIVGSAFCYAVYQVFTRKVAGIDRPETSVMYSALVGTVVMSCVVPFFWIAPRTVLDAGLMLALGLLGAGGHWCVAKAMTYGQASVIAPFQYWQMIGSVLVGYLVSGMFPDGYTWVGAGIIVACGITLAVAESRRR